MSTTTNCDLINSNTWPHGSSPAPTPNFLTADTRQASRERAQYSPLGEMPHNRNHFELSEVHRRVTGERAHLEQRKLVTLSAAQPVIKFLHNDKGVLTSTRTKLHSSGYTRGELTGRAQQSAPSERGATPSSPLRTLEQRIRASLCGIDL